MADLSPWPADSAPERRPLTALIPYARNARIHTPSQVAQIAASMKEFGVVWPALVDDKGEIIAGHGRILAAELNEWVDYPVIVARGWTERQIRAYRIADNQLALNAAWDVKLLAAELGELPGLEALIGFAEGELEALLTGGASADGEGRPLPTEAEARQTLAERFGLPPFSVLNAREGWWQDRKRAWIALGIESELGRGENLIERSLQDRIRSVMRIRYIEAGPWIEARRAEGMDDEAIFQAACAASERKPGEKPPKKPPRAGSKLAMSKTIQREKPHADKALDGDKRRAKTEREARKIYPGKGQDLVKKGYQKNGGTK